MSFVRRPRSTSRSLPIALLRARERVMGPIRTMLADAGVTEQQWRVLRILQEHGTLDASDIADHACLLMPSLTRILGLLEAKGLLSRVRDDEDRRRTLITITDAGTAMIAQNMPEANRIYAELEAAFGTDRLEQLLDLLAELSEKDRPPS